MNVVKLREFRKQKTLSLQRMAALVNEKAPASAPVSASMIDRWEKGAIPRQGNMRRLEAATEGEVTFASFYEGEERPRRKGRSLTVNRLAARHAAATVRRRAARQ